MKLLFLGLILIAVLLIQIYYINYKEGAENIKDSINKQSMINEQQKFNETQIKDADIQADNLLDKGLDWNNATIGLVQTNDENGKVKLITKREDGISTNPYQAKIAMCQNSNSCQNLANSDNCGYCASTGEFYYEGEDGIKSGACPDNKWTKDVKKCEELRDREICSKVKGCADLTGPEARICGYCPLTGKVMPMEKVGDKYQPKYDDICSTDTYNEGLLTGGQCQQFIKEHPCITPYHSSGPHNKECIRKLWKNSGCSDKGLENKAKNEALSIDDMLTKWGKLYGSETGNMKSYGEIGANLKDINRKINYKYSDLTNMTKQDDYNIAKSNSNYCFANSDNIDACNTIFNKNSMPTADCLMKKYLEAGCTKEGDGYKKLSNNQLSEHVKEVNKYDDNNFSKDYFSGIITRILGKAKTTKEKYLKNIKKIGDLALNGETYKERKETSKICYGKIPPPPPPIKKGDKVSRYLYGETYEGIVMNKKGEKFQVMWTKKGSRNRKTIDEKNKLDEYQKKNENNWDKLQLGWDGIYALNNRNLSGDSPDYTWISNKDLRLLKSCSNNKSSCNETCTDTLRITRVNFPKPKDCVMTPWSSWSKCTKNCGGGIQEKTRSIQYPAQYGGTCEEANDLKRERACNTNPCSDPDFSETNIEYPTKCITGRFSKSNPCTQWVSPWGYCGSSKLYRVNGTYCKPTKSLLPLVNKGVTAYNLGECEGDCDRNSDCKGDLVCFQRDKSNNVPPGCKKGGSGDIGTHDYCVDKKKHPYT